jgi:type II secretion system protein H
MKNRRTERGFTLLEILVVVGIMGMMMVLMYPSIMNSLETRNLENSARDIETTLQQARFEAINDKIDCRVRFAQMSGVWLVYLESETATGVWTAVTGFVTKTVSPNFILTVNLPATLTVQFSSVGIVEGYSSTQNSLTFQSLKLKAKGQPDLRVLTIFQGGTILFAKAASG